MNGIGPISILYIPVIILLLFLSVSSIKNAYATIQKRVSFVISAIALINILYYFSLIAKSADAARVIFTTMFIITLGATAGLFWYTVRFAELEKIETNFAYFMTVVIDVLISLLLIPNYFTYWSFSVLRFKFRGGHYYTYGVYPPLHLYLLVLYITITACVLFVFAKATSVSKLYRRRYWFYLGTIFLCTLGQTYFDYVARMKTINLTYIFFGILACEIYWDCYRSSHQYQSYIDHFLVDRLEVGLVMFNYSDTLESFNKQAADWFEIDDSMRGRLTRQEFISAMQIPASEKIENQMFRFKHKDDFIDGRIEILKEDDMIAGVFFVFYNITKEETSRQDLEKYSKNRNDFITTMTHELRTPLNAVIGFSNQLMDKMPKNDYRDQVGLIDKSGRLILRYVDEMTEMMSLLDGVYKLEPRNFNISEELSKSIRKSLYVDDVENKIAFEMHIDPITPTELFADSDSIITVVDNVVSNAFKYTERGRITADFKWITDGGNEGEIELVVQDTGCGMSEEVLENIYIAFAVGTDIEHKHENGIGIGLFITKKLLDLMEGTIQVESHLNIGTKVTVKIPVKVVDHTPISTTEKSEGLDNVDLALVDVRTLVVEDNILNAKSIKRQLEYFGAEVEICYSGEDALEKLAKDNKFDIVFMDYVMPGLNGIETTKRIRSSGTSTSRLPIVAVTADVSEKRKSEFHAAKMNDVIFKPFELKDLMIILTRWLPPKKVVITKRQ